MTLPELLHSLTERTTRNVVLATMYYLIQYKGQDRVTSTDIRGWLQKAHVPKASSINVSDVLGKAVPYVECVGATNRWQLWVLTGTGTKYIMSVLGVKSAEVEHDISRLSALADKLKDDDARDYVQEALKCLQVGALRACVVFAWVGAVMIIRDWVMTKGATAVNVAVLKHQKGAKNISTVDDLAFIKESTLLLVANELKIFDKNEKDTLENYCLDVRNKSGHPGKYRPGEKKVSAVLEDLVSIVFSKA